MPWYNDYKDTELIACIVGTGPSINDLPKDFNLNSHGNGVVFAMNGAVLAPQCTTWDYFTAVDNRIGDPKHYPANLYYERAMKYEFGAKILPSWTIAACTRSRRENPEFVYPMVLRVENVPAHDFEKVELFEEYPGYIVFNMGAVLGYTLSLTYMMGFRKFILFGCDYCIYEGKPHYFFGERFLAEAKTNEKTEGKEEEKKLWPVSVKKVLDQQGTVTMREGRIVPAGDVPSKERLKVCISPTNGKTVYMNTDQQKQIRYINMYLSEMSKRGCSISKYTNESAGMLDLPSITTVEQLREALNT